MSLWNTTRWGDVLPGGPIDGTPDIGVDITQVLIEAYWTLHANSAADLTWWTEAELIEYLDDAVRRLSALACVFVGRVATTVTVASQAGYALPARHISTLHVSLATTPLRPANAADLDARNENYLTEVGTPDHWFENLVGMATVGLTPVPDTSDVPIPIIYNGYPDILDAGKQNTNVPAPPPLKGYLAMYLLAEAYGKEGEAEATDIAAHCRGRMGMYREMMITYYGPGA